MIAALSRPGFDVMTKIRSASWTASSMLWVTMSIAFVGKFGPFQRLSSSVRRFSAVRTSRALNGSSMSRASGSTTSARANPTRWRIPPDSSRRVRGFEPVEADEVDRPFGALAAFGRWDGERLQAHLDVGSDGQPREQRERLEDHRHPRVGAVQLRAAVGDGPGRGRDQPGDAAEQRRLPRAGLPEERDDLAFAELEADVGQDSQRLAFGCREVLRHVVDADDHVAGSGLRRGRMDAGRVRGEGGVSHQVTGSSGFPRDGRGGATAGD